MRRTAVSCGMPRLRTRWARSGVEKDMWAVPEPSCPGANVHWRKASRSSSNGGACVELASLSGIVAVRDSKNPDGPRIMLSRSVFAALITAVKNS